ncbi:unnamed protein product [Darwinula stevensoni]|uniref:mRNA (guanine-N(7))-methyltransferase n=1 Tax=Darwinula stevensoni TaxID=69355 RepID=A0A7R9AAA7_9CRUS|nr:unnamed protein product [Darwinula stevensoni]CAG0898212.1 unnamed protein product [Darwinula stevensoni]
MQTVRGGPPQQSSSGISSPSGQLGHVVAEHYNKLKETGLTERSKSRIFYMRNFNNWIKKRKGTPSHKLHVLDIGCGKGGDLLKWQKHGISHLICTDLADASLEHCRQRYADLQRRSGNRERTFTAEFFQADSTKEVIQEKFKDPNMSVDITSIQFSFHYCFESLSQANMMLKNAAKSLRPGGLLILTMPDCADIMSRWQESGSEEFGNEVYKIRFDSKPKPLPLFGAKYFFSLEEVTYPPFEGERAQGNPESYQHARDWIGKTSEGGKDDSSNTQKQKKRKNTQKQKKRKNTQKQKKRKNTRKQKVRIWSNRESKREILQLKYQGQKVRAVLKATEDQRERPTVRAS